MTPEPALAALQQNPDDQALWRVVADHLSEQGDPRGELILLHDATTKKAERRRKKLVGPLAKSVDAGMFGPRALTDGFERGFLRSIHQGIGTLKQHDPAAIRAWLAKPEVSLLRNVRLYQMNASARRTASTVLAFLEHAPPTLTEVELQLQAFPADLVGALRPKTLRKLSLLGSYGSTNQLGFVPPSMVGQLLESRWPHVHTLHLQLQEGTRVDALWSGESFPSLRHLRLVGGSVEHVVDRLTSSPLLPRLESLDVPTSGVSDLAALVETLRPYPDLEVFKGAAGGNRMATLYNKAWVLMALGKSDAAIPFLERSTTLGRNSLEDVWVMLGNAYHSVGRREDAVSAYRSCLRAHPGYASAHKNSAITLYELQRYDEHLEANRAAREAGAGNLFLALIGAESALALGRADEASSYIDDARARVGELTGDARVEQEAALAKLVARLEEAARGAGVNHEG